jgi:hypothetical protein
MSIYQAYPSTPDEAHQIEAYPRIGSTTRKGRDRKSLILERLVQSRSLDDHDREGDAQTMKFAGGLEYSDVDSAVPDREADDQRGRKERTQLPKTRIRRLSCFSSTRMHISLNQGFWLLVWKKGRKTAREDGTLERCRVLKPKNRPIIRSSARGVPVPTSPHKMNGRNS